MKRGVAIAAAGLMCFGLSAPTFAETPAEPEDGVTVTGDVTILNSGESETGGWVEFSGEGTVTIDDTVATNPGEISTQGFTKKKVGGGTWIYGSTVRGNGQKVCSSEYQNPSRHHTATVAMGAATDTAGARPGQIAKAWSASYNYKTCYAYWSNL